MVYAVFEQANFSQTLEVISREAQIHQNLKEKKAVWDHSTVASSV